MSDDLQRPSAPRFVRRAIAAFGLTGEVPDIRTAEERVRAAREQEQTARSAVATATREREAAEEVLGPARARSQQEAADLKRRGDAWIKDLKAAMTAAENLPTDVTDVQHRGVARTALYGGGVQGGEEGQRLGSALVALTNVDQVAGTWHDLSRRCGEQMRRAFDAGADAATMAELDRLECTCWAALVRRIHVVAGEL